MNNYKILSTDSKGPECMDKVYFYQLNIGDTFLWQNDSYMKIGDEKAKDIRTDKEWVFEIHYMCSIPG